MAKKKKNKRKKTNNPRTEARFELQGEQAVVQAALPLRDNDRPKAAIPRRKKDSVRLRWDSKPKRPPSPRDIDFQIAEVVIPNPGRDEGDLPLSFHDGILGNEEIDRMKMNRLIWGDNLLAMQALLAQGYEGKIDLIYIDPPFDSKSDYSYRMTISDKSITKEPSVVERIAYSDTWESGIDSYLDMFYPRMQLMKRLLSENGSIYIHVDWRLNSYLRLLIDEVFGIHNFMCQIIWKRSSIRKATSKKWLSVDDIILVATKSQNYIFNTIYLPYSEEYKKRFNKKDEHGFYYWIDIGTYSQERLEKLKAEGRVRFPKDPNAHPRIKHYLHEGKGVQPDNIWTDIIQINSQAKEDTGFDTQKPETLLERIIKASSNEGDLVADFFCGSGTTLAVAEKLGRRWIGSDLGKVGIQVTRSRLVEQDAGPFLIENIGNYQREMIYLTGGRIYEMQRIILKLYGAGVHPNYKELGTRRGEEGAVELVYVGYPDRPTTARKAEELARQAETLDGTGYKRLVILAWDYDYNFDAEWEARLKGMKRKLEVQVERRMIPPDVYDYLKKARNEEEVEKLVDKVVFHEKPYLKLARPKLGKAQKGQREVIIGIEKYVIFDLPVSAKQRESLREVIKDNFAILIDYWAVDWDYDGATFRSEWQAIRGNGKRAKVVPTETTHTLKTGQTYTIAVRVGGRFRQRRRRYL